jgi:hypothetical protein
LVSSALNLHGNSSGEDTGSNCGVAPSSPKPGSRSAPVKDIPAKDGKRACSISKADFINVLGLFLLVKSTLILSDKLPVVGEVFFTSSYASSQRLRFDYELFNALGLFVCCFGLFGKRNWARISVMILLSVSLVRGMMYTGRIIQIEEFGMGERFWMSLPMLLGSLLYLFFVIKLQSKSVRARFHQKGQDGRGNPGRFRRRRWIRKSETCEPAKNPHFSKKRIWAWMSGYACLMALAAVLWILAGLKIEPAEDPARLWPPHLCGTWSNQEGEFKTINLGLRNDGRGTLSTAMFPMIVRWEATDEGVKLKATLPTEDTLGQTVDYRLTYDEVRTELLLQSEKRTERLVKVSEEQPVDLEEQVEEAILKKKQQMDAAHTVVVKTLDRSTLMAKLGEFVDSESYFKIRHQEEGWYLRVDKFSTSYITLTSTVRSVAVPSMTMMRYRYRSETLPADLTTVFELHAERLSHLLEKAQQADFKVSEQNLVGKSIWNVEEYLGHRVISGIDTDEALLDLTQYLITETFAGSTGVFEVELLDKSVPNPSLAY